MMTILNIVPMHYGYEFQDNKFTFFMHGAKKGKKLDCIRNNDKAFVELEADIELVSGGDVACQYGSLYKSFMGRGRVSLVSDQNEKIKALKLLMVNQTGREFEFIEQMVNAVEVIKVEIE